MARLKNKILGHPDQKSPAANAASSPSTSSLRRQAACDVALPRLTRLTNCFLRMWRIDIFTAFSVLSATSARRVLSFLLMKAALALGFFFGTTRERFIGRWRLALWALAVALITGTAGGVRLAAASSPNDTVSELNTEPGDAVALPLDEADPAQVISCYCSVAPPHRW